MTAPRLHLEGDKLSVEAGLSPKAVALLKAGWPNLEHWPEPSLFFGGVHGVLREAGGGLLAAGDPRRAGVAIRG